MATIATSRQVRGLFLAGLTWAVLSTGCGDSNSGDVSGLSDPTQTGSSHGTGGSAGNSGNGRGGASSADSSALGGSAATGGHPTAASATGGAGTRRGTGGSSVSSTGGTTGSGGSSARSGSSGAGGSRALGGSSGSGGTQGKAGAVGLGGASHNGGAQGVGGASHSGGAPGAGGGSGLGGSSGGAGGSAVIGAGQVTTSCPGAVPSGVTAAWCSCDQWGEWAHGDATFYNDIWGSGPGPQCIWATNTNQFGVAAKHPATSGIKSYPNISFSPGKAISAINTYTSSFDFKVPNGGAWEVAYDVWVKNSKRIEIMLWMNQTGAVAPIASTYTSSGAVPDVSNVTVGGHTWNVYYGSNGSNDVVSLVRSANTTAGTVDIKAILDWIIKNKGSFNSSWTLDQVQFGPEISSDGGNTQSFIINSFSVSST